MAEDDGVLLPGLAPEGEDDDDTREDAIALFGIDVSSGFAPIDLDSGGGKGAMATRTMVGSTSSTPSIVGTGTSVGKRKSVVWANFDEIYETVNGVKIFTKATCKMCKSTLSARSSASTGHLTKHQKSCKQKLINVLGFSRGLLTILMVLCITGTINLMLLDLSCVT